MEPPRVVQVPQTMVDLYMFVLVVQGGVPFPEALGRILALLRACQSRN
jgi:hypothetical protein